MRCRKNVKDLSPDEKRDFVKAIKALKAANSVLHPGAQTRYDEFVEIHRSAMDAAVITPSGQVTNPGWGHFDSAFFPWHRELLYRFEEELRAKVPGVTIPYWDWTRGQSGATSAWPFTHPFIGVDGTDANQDRVEREAGAPSPYPYEFDPDAWAILVKDTTTEPSFFRRAFAERNDAPNLPQNNNVVTGTGSSFLTAIGSTTYQNLRARSEDIHNLVHRWAGGNMITASSPNDPVFWFHHAQIDRMWTLWQEKHPGTTPYVNTSGFAGHGLNDTLIFHDTGDPAPWAGTGTPNQLLDSHAMHGVSIWYSSDLPELTNESGPSIDFGSVPQGLTQYRAVHFRIQTCRQVRFRIIGNPTGNFSLTPLGAQFIVEPDLAADHVEGYVWVQFVANGGSPQFSSVVVEAYIIDDEGYYAATEGGEFSLGTFTIDLSASVVPRDDNAVVLVLDRSGSMGTAAGGGSTRSQLMKSAVSTFHTLLRATDEIGIVSFDDVTDNLLPLTTQAAGLGTTLTGNGLDPRGSTGIGLGIQAGAAMLAGANHSNRSILVLTDGNQNVHPYIAELPAGTVTNRTYAIGFGLPGDVSDSALHDITASTHGELIITGLLGTQAESYLLTKYFVQMLAGITHANVILDPQFGLLVGSKHAIPFRVTEADVSLDVILLAPAAILADVALQTPSGSLIDPAVAAAEPNIEFHVGSQVSFYRINLPALPLTPSGSHSGTWHIVTRLRTEDELKELLRKRELRLDWGEISGVIAQRSFPYACVVHARSNLDFAAAVSQDAAAPGAMATLTATLHEYGVPFAGLATVWAEVTTPTGATSTLSLPRVTSDSYRGTMTAAEAGVYRLRVRAEGTTSYGSVFSREKSLTVATSAGSRSRDEGIDRLIEVLRERDRALCDLLECVIGHSVGPAGERGIFDMEHVRGCVKKLCARLEHQEPARRLGIAAELEPPSSVLAQLGLVGVGATSMIERRIEPKIEWPDADSRAKRAAELARRREKMIAEHDDPGLMMFPRIVGTCPPDCDHRDDDHVHAPDDHTHDDHHDDHDHNHDHSGDHGHVDGHGDRPDDTAKRGKQRPGRKS